MKFIAQNWWYILILSGFIYMIFRGGCCGGHSHNEKEGKNE